MHRKAAAALGACLLLTVPPAHAENAQTTGFAEMSLKELMSLEVFTAASMTPTRRTRAPGTVYSFNREDFRSFGIRRLEDLFQLLPGFQLNQHRKRHRSIWGRGILDRYNDKFVLQVDGIEVRHLYYGHFSLGDNFPIEKVEKVEIILGPASSLYGANAFAGLISITTREFSDSAGVELSAEVGNHSRVKGTALYNSPKAQLFVSRLSQDAPFDSHRNSFIGTPSEQELGEGYTDVSLKLQPLAGLTLLMDAQSNHTPFLFIPSTQDAYVRNRPLRLSAQYETGDLNSGRLEAKFYHARNRSEEYEIEQQTRRPAYRESQDAGMSGLNLTAFKRLFDDHVFTLGANWKQERADEFSFVRHFHFSQGFLPQPITGSLLRDPGVSNNDYAVFLQDVWDIRPDTTLTLGARYDNYDAFGDHFNYRAALVFSPDDNQVWKLLHGTAIRTPSFREYLKVLEGTDFIPPVPDPERIRSTEIGYQYQWDLVTLGLTLYYNEIEDTIIESPTPNGADEYFTNSRNPWEMRGADASMQARLHPRLHLRANLAWMDAREMGRGSLPYLAQWTGGLNLNYNYRSEHHAGITVIYNGDREDSNAFGDDNSDAFTLINVNAYGPVGKKLKYAVGIDNLFDQQVFDPAADFGSQYNTVRNEREIWLKLEWDLDI